MDKKIMYRWGLVALFCLGIMLIIFSILLSSVGSPSGNSYAGTSSYLIPAEGPESGMAQLEPTPNSSAAGIPQQPGPAIPEGPYFTIMVTDLKTGTPLPGVSLFINGQLAGTTSGNGTFELPLEGSGSNISTIRAVIEGYQEKTVQSDPNKEGEVIITLVPSDVIPIEVNGPPESKINIIFLPSNTSFNATENAKILMGGYPGGQKQFEADVRQFIANTFLKYPSVTSPLYPFPQDYEKKFNFYYFWDGTTYADAFDGCAGTIPQKYWQDVTFSDLTIILYPSYNGVYLGPPGQPVGCTNPNGLGRVYLKISADDSFLAMHEIGHGLYGLMDTYCGDTYYTQNDPDPNVWSSLQNCQETALAQGWNPGACRQISDDKTGCIKDFWRWDSDPDIMHDGSDGSFGNASTMRILNILNRIQS